MVHLIDKDAVVAEINRVLNSYDPNEITSGRYALVSLRDFINTLEVKEVDLEREIKEVQRNYKTIDEYEGYPAHIYSSDIELIAKHFFGLGLKSRKLWV